MKQRILVAVASLLLAALILLSLPPLFPPPAPPPTTIPTAPTVPPTGPTVPPTTTLPPEPVGSVRIYSCDPTISAILNNIALEYTTQTGVEVVVLSLENGSCQETLQQLLVGEDPPTVFCVHSHAQLQAWESTLLNLKDTPLATLLRSEDMAIRENGKWLALPMGLRASGLLVNAELLGTQGALSRADISDFSSLSTAAQILKNNSVKAFAAFAPTVSDAWALLSTPEPEHARQLLDLYLSHHNAKSDGLTQFLDGKAAFMFGDSTAYDLLAGYTDRTFHVRNLDILPTYIGNAMQYFCDWAWCFNASVRQEDIDATIAFLEWATTADDDQAAPIDQLQVLLPFAGSGWYANQLEKKLLSYMSEEPAVVVLVDPLGESTDLLDALNTYLQDPTDEHWEQLRLMMEQIWVQTIPE